MVKTLPIWANLYYKPLTNWSLSQRGFDRETCPLVGQTIITPSSSLVFSSTRDTEQLEVRAELWNMVSTKFSLNIGFREWTVCYKNILWEESRFLNPRKSKTHPKIMKSGMVSWHGTYMSRNFFRPFWRKFYYKPLTNRSFSQRSLTVPIGKRVIFYMQHGTTWYPCWNLNLFRVRLAFLYTNWVS